MRTLVIVSLGMALLGGCSANWVVKDYENRRGVLSYLNQGADSVIESRRNDAVKKMEAFCKGPATILREAGQSQYAGTYSSASAQGSATAHSQGNSTYASGQGTAQGYSTPVYNQWVYVEFRCGRGRTVRRHYDGDADEGGDDEDPE